MAITITLGIDADKPDSAHAALSPWEGTNAQDAAVLAYNNISALRQQIRPTHRVHGIIQGNEWATNGLQSQFPRRHDAEGTYPQ